MGNPVSVFSLGSRFDGSSPLIWADGTDGTSVPSPTDIMARITSSFSSKQLSAVIKVESPSDIPTQCPQNSNLYSQCFAAIAFNDIPANGSVAKPINYTIRADEGLGHIDVINHASDFELRILPLQWAVDQVRHVPIIREAIPDHMQLNRRS